MGSYGLNEDHIRRNTVHNLQTSFKEISLFPIGLFS